ncbi:MAG: hypothetical protein A3E87_07835 [Gammaproteobacteria bacterium RIFCSPHIGHO2_12_FULL_35_23]|nr:MAG: hypothetical protein A3E87_07835 [Gammaproteobacteria bacterium RIFCSPHIGHO2_12_FULL_35_23]
MPTISIRFSLVLPTKAEYQEACFKEHAKLQRAFASLIGPDGSKPVVLQAVLCCLGEVIKNAIDVGATHLEFVYRDDGSNCLLTINDNGPGFGDFLAGQASLNYKEKLAGRHSIVSRKRVGSLGGHGRGLAQLCELLDHYEGSLILSNHQDGVSGACLSCFAPGSYINEQEAIGFLRSQGERIDRSLTMSAGTAASTALVLSALDSARNRLLAKRSIAAGSIGAGALFVSRAGHTDTGRGSLVVEIDASGIGAGERAASIGAAAARSPLGVADDLALGAGSLTP